MSDFEPSYETPIEEGYLAEEEFDQQIAQDYEQPPSTLDQSLADDPSWDAQEADIAAELDQSAESSFDSTLDQAQSFDDILNDGE